ncbi:hypothetical protein CN540_20215 [Bacillus toyonensis]|uniref:hypothetical protein n=1 Tax=Bacillus toyonensis TaxID=155322 RepID=UPI000BF052BE|nr:hypothetical protein [Bacillus toyonensis]PEN53253.1 hypothetical protein CN540_20215 [Bacillus toyonensis]
MINVCIKKILKYLDGKLNEHLNTTYRNITIEQSSEFIEKINTEHLKEDLVLMSSVLEGEIEQGKLFAPQQTFYNSIMTIVVGFFIAMFTFFVGFSNTAVLSFTKDSGKAPKELSGKLKSAFDVSLEVGAWIFIALIIIVSVAGFFLERYRYKFKKYYFYKQIIDKCIEKKEEKEKEEKERENKTKLASSRKGSSRYR